MAIAFILFSVAVLVGSGMISLVPRQAQISRLISVGGSVIGGIGGTCAALFSLAGNPSAVQQFSVHWSIPLGAFLLKMDSLSAFFVLPIAAIPALAAVYSVSYNRIKGSHARGYGFWFNLLSASMLIVVTARNGVLFLVSWEAMTLASFFLVMTEGDEESTVRAGWIYLVAAHVGTAFLVVFFLLFGGPDGLLDFESLREAAAPTGLLFLLALVGFGTKAGFVPMHIWLPEAHPAAPSPVSAVMSGVMIKTGIYGIVRTLGFLGDPGPVWGWVLLLVGTFSGLYGVLHALAQHDLKRLLAYHSVENIGIIGIGLGLGMLGVSYHLPLLAALGFAGALLHVLNHALFKSLLFLGAGAIDCATGTREIDRLGGVMKRLPITGAAFLVGAAAISGLPPLNGFASEFLLLLGAGNAIISPAGELPSQAVAGFVVVGALPLIGGLAAACLAKAFGVVFLGEPRSAGQAGPAGEVPWSMRVPMLLLAALCIIFGIAAPALIALVAPAVDQVIGSPATASLTGTGGPSFILSRVSIMAGVLFIVTVLALLLRRAARAHAGASETRTAGTWDCGYAAPTPRMQYTASSFARGILTFFQPLVRSRTELHIPGGYFPQAGRLHVEPRDPFMHSVIQPLFRAIAWAAGGLRRLQQGRVQLYVLYIAVTVLVLLIWKLR